MSFSALHQSRHGLRNWTGMLADSRKSRVRAAVSLVKADGTYDLAAIMREAVRHARRYTVLPSWQRQMAVALRHVWKLAKAQRLAAAN